MFMRCAYFLGRAVPGQESELQRRLADTTRRYLGFPQISSVQLLMAAHKDEGAPELYATLQLVYDSEQAMHDALALPLRDELRAHFAAQVLPLFEGTVKHINHHLEVSAR